MYGIKIILIFFLSVSCSPKGIDSNFYLETNKRWMAATHIKWKSPHYKQDQKILKPEGTWQPIIEVEFIDLNFTEVSDCLFYKVPENTDDGEIKVVANRSRVECKDLVAEDGYANIKGIINFGYESFIKIKDKVQLVLKVDTDRLKYQFLNLKDTTSDMKLLDSSVDKTVVTGAQISSEVNYKVNIPDLPEGTVCYDVNDKCEVVVKDKCKRCKFGAYKSISSKCDRSFRKTCGMNKCGQKNQVACIRGYIASGLEPDAYCINDSPVGFCGKGLRVVCLNGTLVCE